MEVAERWPARPSVAQRNPALYQFRKPRAAQTAILIQKNGSRSLQPGMPTRANFSSWIPIRPPRHLCRASSLSAAIFSLQSAAFSISRTTAFASGFFTIAATAERFRSYIASRRQAARDIQFHYDRSNEFYRQFLDSRLVYSAAWFENPTVSLEEAQRAKLDRICRDLQLRRGDRFLDIGCGWGGLLMHAAEHFGVDAFGCTLAKEQFEYARQIVLHRGLTRQVTIQLRDYRDLEGRFDKIASVGMFEHVGRKRLRAYFAKVYSLLEPGGLFLNRGIVRPEGVSDGPDTLFIQKYVFPGGGLVHLKDVVREGERVGFTVTGMEDLRLHYALTCRAWVDNLERNSEACKALVGERTYRIWLIYLAASAIGFEQGRIGCAQVLFAKP